MVPEMGMEADSCDPRKDINASRKEERSDAVAEAQLGANGPSPRELRATPQGPGPSTNHRSSPFPAVMSSVSSSLYFLAGFIQEIVKQKTSTAAKRTGLQWLCRWSNVGRSGWSSLHHPALLPASIPTRVLGSWGTGVGCVLGGRGVVRWLEVLFCSGQLDISTCLPLFYSNSFPKE